MPKYHDITVPVFPETPLWDGDDALRVEMACSMEKGAPANVSSACMSLHSGTHVDAPFHFIADGSKVWDIPLDALIGPCWVAEFPDVDAVDVPDLEAQVPYGTERLLLKTKNSRLWQEKRREFLTDFAYLTPAGAEWAASRGIKLVGTDYLSIDRYEDNPHPVGAHLALLRNRIVVLETLNLNGIAPGAYGLICLPLLAGAGDGAPARTVLIEG